MVLDLFEDFVLLIDDGGYMHDLDVDPKFFFNSSVTSCIPILV